MVAKYWGMVLRRAITAAVSRLWGTSIADAPLALLIVATYLSLLLLVIGVDEVKAAAQEQLALWAAPLIWFPLFFLWYLLKTPALVAQEETQLRTRQIDRLEGQIAALRKEEAKLDAKIHQVGFGTDRATGDTTCFVNMTIKNTGAPSAVLHWRIEFSTESKHYNDNIVVFRMANTDTSDVGLALTQQDAINEKATQPIPTGGFVRGWFWFIVRGLPAAQRRIVHDEIEIRILFEDAFGNRGLAAWTASGRPSSPNPSYYPDGTGGPGVKLRRD